MENYIVRIYRRDCSDPEKVTGVLESVERQTRQSFHSIGALQSLLRTAPTLDLLESPTTGQADTARKVPAVLHR